MLHRTSASAPVFGLRREIDRLFEDTFGRGDGVTSWTPAVDVRETDKELRIDVELPGINPDNVELTVENGVLSIRGEKRNERKEDDSENRFHVVERTYGTFMRSFQLPPGLDESKIEADYDNGILAIHIPKTALPQPRKIQIGGSQTASIGNGSKTARTESKTSSKAGSQTTGQSQNPMAAQGPGKTESHSQMK